MITPSTEQVRAIREAWDEGRLSAREWADALDCSLETIRRIGRRDTYRNVDRPGGGRTRALPPGGPAPEPDAEAVAQSLAKLRGLMDKLPEGPQAGAEAIEELKGRPE